MVRAIANGPMPVVWAPPTLVTTIPLFIVQVNSTAKFSVVDLASLKVNHVVAAGGPKSPKGGAARDKTRLTQSTGQSIKKGEGKIGGAFTVTPNPPFLTDRVKYYEKLAAKQAEKLAGKPPPPLTNGWLYSIHHIPSFIIIIYILLQSIYLAPHDCMSVCIYQPSPVELSPSLSLMDRRSLVWHGRLLLMM